MFNFKLFKKKKKTNIIVDNLTEAPPWMISDEKNITLILEDQSHTIGVSHPNHAFILQAIRDEMWSLLPELVDVPKAITAYTEGTIEVNEFGEVLFKGEIIHNTVTDRITEFYKDQLPYQPLIRFLERLMANPSQRAVDELYRFLENEGMPITEDGCFIGYKGIKDDFTDCHSGSVDNSPGQIVSMPRDKVDANPYESCSYGYHVGSQAYAATFGSRTVLVKVDPADAVSVPHADAQKLRVCKYEVVREQERILTEPLFREDVEEEDDFSYIEDDEECYTCGELGSDCRC